MALFGIAIAYEWNSQLTPRARNRPSKVLKNTLKQNYSHLCSCCLWANFYSVTWLLWTYRITYPQGLDGIPGTGTRNNGWSGPTLKWNLDGVILLKYHRMLCKISVIASLLCVFILIPAYSSATCDPNTLGIATCEAMWNLTDFENLTISHVPDKVWHPSNYTINATLPNGTFIEVPPQSDLVNPIEGKIWVSEVSSRTFLVCFCCLIIYFYTCCKC